ncbi:MAG: UDP-N-acetylglucosamine 1-carboxyvinyltransferase [Lentisphaeria bacterium]|nr:UDP-N-acetylglucosamine 1-carboxyvinyltransferase [Lentisphaeria bacterium]
MRSLIINGTGRISGTVEIGGNKNAVLPMIAATLLTKDDVTLHNVPAITDVDMMLKILTALGAKIRRKGSSVTINTAGVTKNEIPRNLCSALRTSFLFAGPLAVRCGSSVLYPPGGDVIGRRRLDSHFYGLKKLGIPLRDEEEIPFVFETGPRGLHGADIFLDEASVTATEHILMVAAAAKGNTVIRNAASEPHVRQLGEMLNAMGAEITGLDSNTIQVKGGELHGAEVTVEGDHIEAASFIALAACTRSPITITGIMRPHDYWMTRRMFEKLGIHFKIHPNLIEVAGGQRMKIKPDFGKAIPQISDGPWPQFPSDMMSCMIVCATQAKGSVLFFEKMFESRIYFVDRLIAMGANAVVCDPHRVVISGPAKLHAVEMSSPDIRAGMAMVLAAVCAKGRSVVQNADNIFRGYANICEKLTGLGVEVTLEEH